MTQADFLNKCRDTNTRLTGADTTVHKTTTATTTTRNTDRITVYKD